MDKSFNTDKISSSNCARWDVVLREGGGRRGRLTTVRR